MKTKNPICPYCKTELNHLDFDVTATCSAQIYKEDLKKQNPTEYDLDCLTSNAQFDNFRCPECSALIGRGTEEEAKQFLKNIKDKNKVKPKYKEGFILLMDYWDSLPDEDKPEIHKALMEMGL